MRQEEARARAQKIWMRIGMKGEMDKEDVIGKGKKIRYQRIEEERGEI